MHLGLAGLASVGFAAAAAACGGSRSGGAPDGASSDPADADPTDGRPAATTFTRHTIDAHANGPAYVAVATIGGTPTVVVSSSGHATTMLPSGTVTAYARGATLDQWTATAIVPESDQVAFPNQPTLADVDGDGDLDVIVPSGFLVCAIPFIPGSGPCGAIAWYEQAGATWTRHALITAREDFYHHVELADLDGDHLPDLITTGEYQPFGSGTPRATVSWLRGTHGADRFEPTVRALADGGGSFPRVRDLDGDGDLDVASAEYFVKGGSFAWFEQGGANDDAWTRHVIDDGAGPAIELTLVDDLIGDGALHAIGTNHVNTAKSPPDPEDSAVFLFDVPVDPTQPWTRHTISQGIVSRPGSQMAPLGAPGIFGVGDLDGDGDADVAVSGDGDAHVYWLEQTAPGTFATHVLTDALGQAGGMAIADLDGDGKNELVVTGYEDDAVYVYTRN